MGAKKTGRALIAAVAAAALRAAPAHADDKAKEQQFFDPQNEVLHYENHLNLTDKQKPEVLKILQDKLAMYKHEAAKRERITKETRQLSELIQKNNRELESIQKEQQDTEQKLAAKMRGLLTDEQRKKFDALEAERLRQQREFEAAHRAGQAQQGQQSPGAMGDQPGADGATPIPGADRPQGPR